MPAHFLKFGDPPPTVGGDFERAGMRELRDTLPDHFVVLGNPSFATLNSNFYECDVVVVAPNFCDILEFKSFRGQVTILEDALRGAREFVVDRPFSILESKAKVIRSRLEESPFFVKKPQVGTRIIVPDGTRIVFGHDRHRTNEKVMSLSAVKSYLSKFEFALNRQVVREQVQRLKRSWETYRSTRIGIGSASAHRLGRFSIKRKLESRDNSREFCAVDEPPCKVNVHLREFPFDPLLGVDELELYLEDVSREMQTLRRIRHPYIACVVGHFQTECSLVQVSDWFDGVSIEDGWATVRQLSLSDKIGLFLRIVDALAFCHEKGVFHRNISAANTLVDENAAEVRIKGFEFAKDLELTQTVGTQCLAARDPRLFPPEELVSVQRSNPRTGDIFQAGVLFYRVLEGGSYPFDDPIEYGATGAVRSMVCHEGEDGIGRCRDVVRAMIRIRPADRPDPLSRVRTELRKIIGGGDEGS